jgi:DNA-binding Lrp family transcriptional regulator
MVEAFVLVQAEAGELSRIAAELGQIGEVKRVETVTGPYDAVLRIAADDVDSLGRLVVQRIHAVAGITRTLTCPIARF